MIFSSRFLIIPVLAIIISGFPGCTSISAKKEAEQDYLNLPVETAERIKELSEQADRGDIFADKAMAKTPTIGILKPGASYLSAEEQWIPDMIKSAMNNNFRIFAAGRIIVTNIADEEALNNEINKSLSGSDDELSLIARMAARALMTGKVIKIQGTTRFTLEFTITDTETHAIIASYSQNHSDLELSEGIAVNKATESLLKDLNVRLNDAGRYALYGASNEAETALAKGLSAAESGNSLQAMNYLFNAASYHTTASQASAPLAFVQGRNQRELQGAGAIVMDFFERQELWQSRLDDFNNFYSSHAPFELFYTTPIPTNMKGAGDNRSYDISFDIGLRWNQNQITVMEQVLSEYILTGLSKNSPQDIQRWELKGLPDNSILFKGPDNLIYNLLINIENERGEIITSGPLMLYGSLYRYQEKIYASCTQEYKAAFNNIKYEKDMITPQLYIRIVSINGVNIKTVGENGFIRVAQTQDRELPAIQPNNLPKGLVNSMEKEFTAAKDREKTAEKEAERQRLAREKERDNSIKAQEIANIRNSYRIGIGAYGGPALGAKAGTINVNVEVGVSSFDFEFGYMFYLGNSVKFSDLLLGGSDAEISALSLNFGLNYVFIGRRWFLNIGPGLTIFQINDNSIYSSSSSETYYFPNLLARFDFKIFSLTYIRVGYRLDFYSEELSPYFEDNSMKGFWKFILAHNILFGVQFII